MITRLITSDIYLTPFLRSVLAQLLLVAGSVASGVMLARLI
jgi:hypothetical protein